MTKSPENADPRLRQAVKTGTNNDTGKMPVPRDFNGPTTVGATPCGCPVWPQRWRFAFGAAPALFGFHADPATFALWGRHSGLPLRVSMGASDVGATPRGCPVCPQRRCTRTARTPLPATKSRHDANVHSRHTGRRGRRPSRFRAGKDIVLDDRTNVRPDGADGLGVGGVLDSFLPGRDGVRHENHPGRCRPTAMGRSEEFSSEIVNMIAVVLEEERPCSVCLRGVLLEVVGVLFWLFWSVGD